MTSVLSTKIQSLGIFLVGMVVVASVHSARWERGIWSELSRKVWIESPMTTRYRRILILGSV